MGYSYIPDDMNGLKLVYVDNANIKIEKGKCLTDGVKDKNLIRFEEDNILNVNDYLDTGVLEVNTFYYVYAGINTFEKENGFIITKNYGNPVNIYFDKRRFIGIFKTKKLSTEIEKFFYKGENNQKEYFYNCNVSERTVLANGGATVISQVVVNDYVPQIANIFKLNFYNSKVSAGESYVSIYTDNDINTLVRYILSSSSVDAEMVNKNRDFFYNVTSTATLTAVITSFIFRV